MKKEVTPAVDALELHLHKVRASLDYYDSIIQKEIPTEEKKEEMQLRMKLTRDQILDSSLRIKKSLAAIKKELHL
jgi:hypothetical protein